MIGVTAFGLFLTPVFYVGLRALAGNRPLRHHGKPTHVDALPAGSGAVARAVPAARHEHE
jgi:multidrug efflux pump